MDEYSRACTEHIEGVKGNPENPYDTEMKNNLMYDRVKRAGSNSFLELAGNKVFVRHTTVKEYFGDQKLLQNYHALVTMIPFAHPANLESHDQSLPSSLQMGYLCMTVTVCRTTFSPR